MSFQKFDDNCPGCKPVVLNPDTMKRYPDDHPFMMAALKAWSETTPQQREAFHNVMCLNSRDPLDLALVRDYNSRLKDALCDSMKKV